MNIKFVLTGVITASLLLTSCTPSVLEPSDEHPNGILFQNIDILIDDNSIQVSTDLSSSGGIYLSANTELQYLTINNNGQYPLEFITSKVIGVVGIQNSNITTISTEVLPNEIQSNDEFKVVFSRANGSILESWAEVPEEVNYITPLADDVYDHSAEDLVVSWQSQTINNRLFLTGGCLANDGNSYTYIKRYFNYTSTVSFLLNPEQTSLTIPAKSLISINSDNTQCEITISLFPISRGYIDENLAGGKYTLQKQSSLRVILTNLKATYDE
ncbi:MAG: hypothetical protein JKY14_10710 [Paraglaciecola sp.]|nr:hypothetical protein [Paraglaciecola sp.]